MKVVDFKPTTGITLTNDTYDDGFADYLKSILEYWNETYSKENCKLSLNKVATDNTGKTARLQSDNCSNKLSGLVEPAMNNKNISKKDIFTNLIEIVWIKKGEEIKSTETKKQKKELTISDTDSEKEAAKKIAADIFSPFASKIASSISGIQLSHYESDKKLVEEINRIKKLIK